MPPFVSLFSSLPSQSASRISSEGQRSDSHPGRLGGNTPRPTGRLGPRPGQHFPSDRARSDRGNPHHRSLYSLKQIPSSHSRGQLNTGRLGGNTPRPTGRLGRRPGQHFPGSDRGKPHLRSLYSLSKFQAHTVEGRGASQGGRQKIPTNTQPKHQILAPDFTESRLLPKTDDTDFKNMQPRGFEATTIGPTKDC